MGILVNFFDWLPLIALICVMIVVLFMLINQVKSSHPQKPAYDINTVQTRIFAKRYKTNSKYNFLYFAQVYNGKNWENLEPLGEWQSITKQKEKIDYFLAQLLLQHAESNADNICYEIIDYPQDQLNNEVQ